MSTEYITIIFEICIIPLLGALATFAIKFLNAKSKELSANVDNATAEKYINMITITITNCVIATNQTYVDSLKEQGSFDKEAQKVAFDKTLDAVLAILNEDAKAYIQETAGDVNVYLTQLIEAEVNKNKLFK